MTQSFSHERYNQILSETIKEIQKLGALKGGEYAGDNDRLANFRRIGLDQELPMATIWRVYAGKHWDAVSQYIKDERQGKSRKRLEGIQGRIDDLLVYLILLKCIVEEGELETANMTATEVSRRDPRTEPGYKVGPYGEEGK